MKPTMRIGALLLSVLLLAGAAAACTPNEPAESGEPSTAATTTAAADPADNPQEPESTDPDATEPEATGTTAANSAEKPDKTTKAPGKQTTAATKGTTKVYSHPKRNIKGMTFTIAAPWGSITPPDKAGKSEYGDKLIAHFDALQKNTGCKVVKVKTGPYNEFQNNFNTACLSNTFYADIIEAQIWQIRTWMRQGYLAEMDTLGTLDLKSDKYLQSKTNLAYYDGHYYGTDFTSWYGRYINFNNGAMLVNLDMMKANGIDVYKLIENGQWTREKYREIAKKFTYSKGGKKIDRWGICGIGWVNMLWSAGQRGAKWNGKKYVFGMNNTEAMGAMQYLLDMIYKDKSVSWEWSLSSTYYGVTDLWAKQKVAMYPIDMEWLGYGDEDGPWFTEVDFNYGLVPMPNFSADKAQPNYKGQFFGETRLFAIPKTAAKGGHSLADVGYFFDLLTDPIAGTNKDSWKESVRENMFQGNEKSFAMYERMLKNAEFDNTVDMGPLQLIPWQTTINNMFTKNEMTPAEAIQTEAEAFQTYLDGYVNNDAKLLKSRK